MASCTVKEFLPSDSSVELKHGREKRDENLYLKHSSSVYRGGECKWTTVYSSHTIRRNYLHKITVNLIISNNNLRV